MEKSIEHIWKHGFDVENKLIVPKLNDLYNRKSKHIVAKFKRMFIFNTWFLIIFSVLFLIYSFFNGFLFGGILIFVLFNSLVLINRNLFKTLNKLDTNVSSFEYITSFDSWLKVQVAMNKKMAHFYYPLLFVCFMMGLWFSDGGQEVINEVLGEPHQIYLVNGVPVYWVLGMSIIAGLFAIFGGAIYKLDLYLMYGHIFRKLEELMKDINELKN
ncbi:MAG: hypothetical protein COB98_05585 [Flavobacteriaceae bacterium]|nr:MAG: hypothetical protein COB98_05585 [Flavobacteriaceae bacterium]